MAKQTNQTVETPTIDKLADAHEAKEEGGKISSQPVPHYVIYRHPIFIIWRVMTQFFILLPFVLLFTLLPLGLLSAIEKLLMQAILGLLVLNVLVNNYIYWRLNVALIFPETLQLFYFNNLMRQHNESFEISRLNTFDILRKGMLSYIFNYATINLSTIVKEVESEDKLCIELVRRPEEAIKMIKYYALK
jgi:hypothetical protein